MSTTTPNLHHHLPSLSSDHPHQPPTTTTATSHDGLPFYQYMLAGSIAGCAEHMAMFPIDTIKTRMQALSSSPITPRRPSGLYRGITAMGLGAGPAHAVYFSVYELCKRKLSGGAPDHHLAHAVSGVCATVMSDAVLTPMDMVKQRLQLSGGAYHGVVNCVRRVFKEEGFKAFYASYRTTVVMNAPFTAVHFAVYEAAKRALVEVKTAEKEVVEEEGVVVHATAGAVAGAIAAVVTTPLDVVKTQLQCQGVCGCDRFTSGSMRDVIKTIIQKDGYRGLMRGWTPRMMFHAPAAAICWSTYEASKTFFQDLNHQKDSTNLT